LAPAKRTLDHVEFDAGLSDFNTKEYTTFKQIVEVAGHKPANEREV
jgi:hypothetical protein